MASVEPIRGQVAKVLSARELVINKGSEDGVILGMQFNVLDPNGLNITDPETQEIIGSVHRPKVQVAVTQVEPRLSIGRTFRYRERNVGGQGMGATIDQLTSVAKLFEPPKMIREYETFRTEEAPWEDISESQSYVKIGDPVEQVLVIEGEPTGRVPQHFQRSVSTSVRPSTTAEATVARSPEGSSQLVADPKLPPNTESDGR